MRPKKSGFIAKRKAGMSYRAIAKELDISFGSVQKVGKSMGFKQYTQNANKIKTP